jgi:hypothetical protein
MDVQRRSRGSATLPATRAATCFKRATPTRRYADTPTRASLGQSVSVLPVNRCLRCPLRFHGCLSLRINRAHRQAGRRKTENNDLNTFHTDTQRRCAVERENEGEAEEDFEKIRGTMMINMIISRMTESFNYGCRFRRNSSRPLYGRILFRSVKSR